ncbi:MAG TPA: HlyD family secretion protein [Roseiarcus sp.]|nr:HlyD family secretion protein [Roseiarcus sp.]
MSQDQEVRAQGVAFAPTSNPPAVVPGGSLAAVAKAPLPAPAPQKRFSLRRVILPVVVLAAIGYGVSFAYQWFVEGRFIVSTDDAYVGADTAVIAAKVAGHISSVAVADNAQVHSGDLLVKIDDGDYRLAVDTARNRIDTQDATVARIGRQVDAQRSVIAQAESQAATARAQQLAMEADAQRAALEFERAQKLAQLNFGSQQRLEQAQADRDRTEASKAAAAAAVASADAAVSGAKANLDVLSAQKVEAERSRAELQTALAKAERDLSFTTVSAPFDGVVGNRAAQVGEYVQPGTRLLALVPLASAYVDANFKETQLASIRPGQKVDIAVDSLDGRVIEGTVTSVAPASGSQFSLLPPDNATGNFTKVVQRVPVRIALPADALRAGQLRPGLSVVASVHTRDESQPRPTLLSLLGLGVQASQFRRD